MTPNRYGKRCLKPLPLWDTLPVENGELWHHGFCGVLGRLQRRSVPWYMRSSSLRNKNGVPLALRLHRPNFADPVMALLFVVNMPNHSLPISS